MAVEAAEILVEGVLVAATWAVDSAAAVSAVVSLVVPASAASTEAVFAQRLLSQVAVHALAATGVSPD
jgi:PhoPQ-activated pathogenicity-related protein